MPEQNLYLTQDIVIERFDEVKERVEKLSNKTVSKKELIENLVHTKQIYYFTNSMQVSTKETSNAMYLWISTGIKTYTGDIMFLSLLATDTGFSGYYIGNIRVLTERACKFHSKNNKIIKTNMDKFKKLIHSETFFAEKCIAERKDYIPYTQLEKEISEETADEADNAKKFIAQEANSVCRETFSKDEQKETECEESRDGYRDAYACTTAKLAQEIQSIALINNFRQTKGIERFIKIIGARIEQLEESNRTEFHIKNKTNMIVVNTGLLNCFGNDILVMYAWNMRKGGYQARTLVDSKKTLINAGFTQEQIKQPIKPIRFYDEHANLPDADVTIDDFDMSMATLTHIIEDRIDRFPKEIQSMPLDHIASKIDNSLRQGIKMLQRDRTYAKAIYSTTVKNLTWLLPLHINTSFTDKPEMCFAFRKNHETGYYELRTVFAYDDEIQDRITAVSLYSKGTW